MTESALRSVDAIINKLFYEMGKSPEFVSLFEGSPTPELYGAYVAQLAHYVAITGDILHNYSEVLGKRGEAQAAREVEHHRDEEVEENPTIYDDLKALEVDLDSVPQIGPVDDYITKMLKWSKDPDRADSVAGVARVFEVLAGYLAPTMYNNLRNRDGFSRAVRFLEEHKDEGTSDHIDIQRDRTVAANEEQDRWVIEGAQLALDLYVGLFNHLDSYERAGV